MLRAALLLLTLLTLAYAAPASAQAICPAYLLRTELASLCSPQAVLPFVRNNDDRFRHRVHDHDRHDRFHEPEHHHEQARIRVRPPRAGKKRG